MTGPRLQAAPASQLVRPPSMPGNVRLYSTRRTDSSIPSLLPMRQSFPATTARASVASRLTCAPAVPGASASPPPAPPMAQRAEMEEAAVVDLVASVASVAGVLAAGAQAVREV